REANERNPSSRKRQRMRAAEAVWKEVMEEVGRLNGTGVQINVVHKERGSSRRRPSPTLPPSPNGDRLIVKGGRAVGKRNSHFFRIPRTPQPPPLSLMNWRDSPARNRHASVARAYTGGRCPRSSVGLEPPPSKRLVAGSNPAGGASLIRDQSFSIA